MTLVAAYKSAGVPILLGDFLISSGEDRQRGRKKIARFRKNLVVGWTGSLLEAEAVLSRLYDDLDDEPSSESLAAWFSSLDQEIAPSETLKLAGWICNGDRQLGFLWGGVVGQLVWSDEWFVGSGGESFEAAHRRYRSPMNPAVGPDIKEAIEGLLATLSQLNCIDMRSQESYEMGVGGGYEALYWSAVEKEFKYLDNVIYFTLQCRMNVKGELDPKGPSFLQNGIASYRSVLDEYCVLALPDDEDPDGYGVWAMSPVGPPRQRKRILAWLRKEGDRFTWAEADYFAGLMLFAAPNRPAPPVPMVACPWDGQKILQGSYRKLELKIPSGAIEQVYREQASQYAADPYPLMPLRS